VIEPVQVQPQKQTPAERIAEIEQLLSTPLTGEADDADFRASLRAERDALQATYGYRSRAVSSQSTQQGQYAQEQQQQQQRYQAQQADREHQRMIEQLKYEAERSRIAEERKLQAQRDQWDREDRLRLRYQNGNFHPEAPPQNTYDIQIEHTDNDDNHHVDHHRP
jgi:hypothetical protein